ncbi:hypothetical protein JDW15_10420 [Aerococcaceae bacterium zg-ZJ1578]|uniref:hypothetical protein n=1 Tax=Aerococcaceae bacterium zg-252 TaxID=2796928 RepID=UPI001A2A49C9|nr:hypothetical protein [Aerococcaceae bacterium zg-1578]
MKKVVRKIFILTYLISVFTILTDGVRAQEEVSFSTMYPNELSIERRAVMPPTKIWWDFLSNVNLGNSYYKSVARKDGVYRGYLSINWNKSFGGNYFYEGYLYPEGKPFPIPTKIEMRE